MEVSRAIDPIDDKMCWGRGTFSAHHMPEYAEYWQADEMAIDALKKQEKDRWIPCKERLPEPRIDVWCNSDLGQMVGYYDEIIETWYGRYGRNYLEWIVTAWRPLPEPFREEE